MNRLIELVIVCVVGFAGFIVGGWTAFLHESEISSAQSNFTKTMLTTGHYKFYGQIADYLERNCPEAALTQARMLRDSQAYLVAENLKDSQNDPELLEYIESKAPELLKAIQNGNIPKLDGHWVLTCPSDSEQIAE